MDTLLTEDTISPEVLKEWTREKWAVKKEALLERLKFKIKTREHLEEIGLEKVRIHGR